MYYIKRSEWKEMELEHPDYCGTSIHDSNIHVIFEGLIPGNNGKGGTTLLFEHKHFEIVDDNKFTVRFADIISAKPEEKPDKKKEISIEDLWTYACSGDVENLKAYYESGSTANRRYYKFGVYHSLIAGAYRNGYYDVVSFLLDNGETITKEEHREIDIRKVYMDEFLQTVDNVISYFKYHNKNLNRGQENQLDKLEEMFYKVK